MLVAPCSVKTLSGIAHCYDDNLVVRAADVCLKERRRVVLMLRETPLHAGHIDLMAQATRNGAIIMPPVPAFYALPTTIDDVVVLLGATAAKSLMGSDFRLTRHRGEALCMPADEGVPIDPDVVVAAHPSSVLRTGLVEVDAPIGEQVDMLGQGLVVGGGEVDIGDGDPGAGTHGGDDPAVGIDDRAA